jgi:hypothetical protein
MFYSNNLFTVTGRKDGSGMAVIWMAATVGSGGKSINSGLRKLSRKVKMGAKMREWGGVRTR